MNNLSSYFGLVDARISASEKDLPVPFLTVSDLTTSHNLQAAALSIEVLLEK